MSELIAWVAAEAERPKGPGGGIERVEGHERSTGKLSWEGLPAHGFPLHSDAGGRARDAAADAGQGIMEQPGQGEEDPDRDPANSADEMQPALGEAQESVGFREYEFYEYERERRIYRRRVVVMLRRYMKYSIETGRMPSLLGKESFRAKVTAYRVMTFEDRVIFVHDMEKCLARLDEFSRQLIARQILQEHDRWATARLLGCNEKTVRRLTPFALDRLSDILLAMGLMERIDRMRQNSCQGGQEQEKFVSDCEDGENKF
jgi:hypothetical protein